MAKILLERTVLLLTVEGDEVTEVRLDYVVACSDCGEETQKSLTITDCNPGQINAIKNICSAMVQKAEQKEG